MSNNILFSIHLIIITVKSFLITKSNLKFYRFKLYSAVKFIPRIIVDTNDVGFTPIINPKNKIDDDEDYDECDYDETESSDTVTSMDKYFPQDFLKYESNLEETANISILKKYPHLSNPLLYYKEQPKIDKYSLITNGTDMESALDSIYQNYFQVETPTIDTCTIITPCDSFALEDEYIDTLFVKDYFDSDDIEYEFQKNVTNFRKSLKNIDTYYDPFLKMDIPRKSLKWHGYPDRKKYPIQSPLVNQFTKMKNKTDFKNVLPQVSRFKSMEISRKKNNEWLTFDTSQQYHDNKRKPYEKYNITIGTLYKDPNLKIPSNIKPVLEVLGNTVELLEILQDNIYRFHYYGLIRNKKGIAAWTKNMLLDVGLNCTHVIMETGLRRRDHMYEGGNSWYGSY